MSKNENLDVRFGKFGTVSFTTTTRVNDFIDYLEDGKLMATQCRVCGAHYFPPRVDCCHCLSSDIAWEEVTGIGKLVSYSQLKFAPSGFDSDLPYSIALLEYEHYRIFGRLDSSLDLETVKIGMAMIAVVDPLPSGKFTYVFKKAC
jgi:uncharacterized protein